MVVIEDGDDWKAIATPDLRIVFRWSGDRWSHAVEIRPGPWQTVASAVEGSEVAGSEASRPTYQQLHLQRDGDAAVALAVGQAGDHHYSASFRVSYRAWRRLHFKDPEIVQDRSQSLVTIDVADRCRTRAEATEALYRVLSPPICTYLGDEDDGRGGVRRPTDWRSLLVWETGLPHDYHVALLCPGDPPTARVALLDRDGAGGTIQVGPAQPDSTATSQFRYEWEHHRVSVYRKESDDDVSRPWTMTMEPGLGPPAWAFLPDGPQGD